VNTGLTSENLITYLHCFLASFLRNLINTTKESAHNVFLLFQGQPQVTLVDGKNTPVPFKLVDNKDKTFRVEFQATVVGLYTLTVTFSGQPVPRSPFKITVEGGVGGVADASKVKVYGPAIEKPVPAGSATYLVIDCKEAGPGGCDCE